MGGSRMLYLSSHDEWERLKRFLRPLDGGLVAGEQAGVWFLLSREQVVEIHYQTRAQCAELAEIVAREIARRFKCGAVGADGGWYPGTDWNSREKGSAWDHYGDYDSWVAWLKDYKLEFSHYYYDEEDREDWEILNTSVINQFVRLDEASDPKALHKSHTRIGTYTKWVLWHPVLGFLKFGSYASAVASDAPTLADASPASPTPRNDVKTPSGAEGNSTMGRTSK